MMEGLIRLLHEEKHSLVVANGDIRTFDRRGVFDLYDLLQDEPEFLKGASIADKVVGKGAAALMILGDVRELHADVISKPALDLLEKSNKVKTTCSLMVPYIKDRSGQGMCPIETLCMECKEAEECLPFIKSFVEEHKNNAPTFKQK